MDLESRLAISYYKQIGILDNAHRICLVQHPDSHQVYIKKQLSIYNSSVYEQLKRNSIPGIPQIFEICEEDDQLTVIEEYVFGQTLDEILAKQTSMSIEESLDIALSLCQIISGLHAQNPPIIHRDLKPANILIRPDGNVVLLDFNAAKNASIEDKPEDTTLLGTRGYAAPEQYGFGTSDEQTDIYALGMVMNAMLCGDFSSNVIPNTPLTPIITKCIQLNPADRFKDVKELSKALKKIAISSGRDSESSESIRTFLPPGFRHFNPINMLVSTSFYCFLFWLCLDLKLENLSLPLVWFERIMTLLIFLSVVFCTCNYLNVQRFMPLCHSSNKFIRVLGIFLLDFIVFGAMLTFMLLISTFCTSL